MYAGSAGQDSSVGRFVIVRQNLVVGRQTLSTVDAGATGAVSIRSAPAGEAVETSAQRADIAFQGANGRKGLLHLAHDTVTLGP